MRLVVTEKNDAAQQIARLLCDVGRPKADKVYNTPIYRFTHEGDEWVTIGLRGHIMAPDFPPALKYSTTEGWYGETADGEHLPADIPDTLARPPYDSKRKPYLKDGIARAGRSRACRTWSGPRSRRTPPRRRSSARSRTWQRRPISS